jgi:hypothetical protein
MDSDPRIPIRETLATAVKLVGGSLVDDLLSNVANRPKNADYVFPQDNAIGELKCLEQDSTDWFTEKLHSVAACVRLRGTDNYAISLAVFALLGILP